MEVPFDQLRITRTVDWYKINQDFYNKMPETAKREGEGTMRGLLSEDHVDVSLRQAGRVR